MVEYYYIQCIPNMYIFNFNQESDRSNRFDYLLQQTEIFSHFMTSGANLKGGSPVKMKPGRPKLKKNDEKAKLSAVGE